MVKCADVWCQHYNKTNSVCDTCLQKETERKKIDLRVLLKQRVANRTEFLMEQGETKKKHGQKR